MLSASANIHLIKSFDQDIADQQRNKKPLSDKRQAYAELFSTILDASNQIGCIKMYINLYLEKVNEDADEEVLEECIKNLKDINYFASKDLVRINTDCHRTIKMLRKMKEGKNHQNELSF